MPTNSYSSYDLYYTCGATEKLMVNLELGQMAHQHGWPSRMALMQQPLICCRMSNVLDISGAYLRISVMTCKFLNTNTVDFPTVTAWCRNDSVPGSGNKYQVGGTTTYHPHWNSKWPGHLVCWQIQVRMLPTERLHSIHRTICYQILFMEAWDCRVGAIRFLPPPQPSIVIELSRSDKVSKASLQSISCRDWWLARLLILCNKKNLAINDNAGRVEAYWGNTCGDKCIIGEVKWRCFDLFWTVFAECHGQQCWQNVLMSTNFCLPPTFPWVSYLSACLQILTMPFTKLSFFAHHYRFETNLPKVILREFLCASALRVCLLPLRIPEISSKQVFLTIFATSPTLTSSSEDSSESNAFSCCDSRTGMLQESRSFGGWRTNWPNAFKSSQYFQHSSHVQMLSQKLDSRISTLRKYTYISGSTR